eukprot:909884-Rhodomonas_salina.1
MYNDVIRQFANAAIGISISKEALKSMASEKKWSTTLEAQFGAAASKNVTFSTVVGRHFGGGEESAGVREVKQENGYNRAVLPPPSLPAPRLEHKVFLGEQRDVGCAMIVSASVAGANVKGMRPSKGATCTTPECGGPHH